jgi:rRNA maturation endonuclease Nob1
VVAANVNAYEFRCWACDALVEIRKQWPFWGDMAGRCPVCGHTGTLRKVLAEKQGIEQATCI